MNPIPAQSSSPSRADLDIATGVLVGLRGGSARSAHEELLATAERYRLSLLRLSRALIRLAAGDHDDDSRAGDVAELLWGGLVRDREAFLTRPRLDVA